MKKQKIEIKAMYLGNIKKCLSLTEHRIHIVEDQKKVCLIEFNDKTFTTYKNYVEEKYNILKDYPSYEGELFVDRNSLEPLDYVESSGIIQEKNSQKRLLRFVFKV